MENSPFTGDDDSENESSDKKESSKKKRELGYLAVERKKPETSSPEVPKAEKLERSWRDLENTKNKEPNVANEILEKSVPTSSEVDAKSEAEAPTETVGEAEQPVVEQQLVDVVRELDAERPPDPDTDPAVERFRDLVEEGKGSQAAFEEVMAELGADEAEPEAEIDPEAPAEFAEDDILIHHAEIEPEDEVEPPIVPPADGATSGGTTPPPIPPNGPGPGHAGLPPNQPPFAGANFGPAGPSFNTVPVQATAPNKQPRVERYDQTNPAAMALFGGVIGYLIGRRRGRIKTEKKLMPIQKKLEKQVENLQWQLQEKEARIRRVAAAKVHKHGPAVIERIAETNTQRKLERPAKTAFEISEKRRAAPEAHQLHGSLKAHEHIGSVVIAAESLNFDKTEKSEPGKYEFPKDKRIETLNRTELLALSEKIVVDGSSLRQIYETHLVGERGLRRLVQEHLSGGDLKKALRQEIVEREIDFERDPAMRDQASSGGGAVAGGKSTLNELIEKAAVTVTASGEQAAFYKARAAYQASEFKQEQQKRRLMDISLVTTIAFLTGAVIYLMITRY